MLIEDAPVAGFGKHPSIQVAAGNTGDPGMVARIDEVRANLE
jgi:hypothetical protein